MRTKITTAFFITAMVISSFSFTGCEAVKEAIEPQPTPTKDLMQGVWKVTEVYDTAMNNIIDKVSIGIAPYYQLNSDNGINSTSGALTSMLVYGDNKWTEATSKMQTLFNYANLSFSTGEFFIGLNQQTSFTLEMKLKGISGSGSITDLLSIFGAGTSTLAQIADKTVYHKFINVGVSFSEDKNTMTWTFNQYVTTKYNYKNDQGDYLLWNGWEFPFKRMNVVLVKQVKTLNDLVNSNYNPQN